MPSKSVNRLIVLCGGQSAEHEVSFRSVASVLEHLDRTSDGVAVLGIGKDGATLPAKQVAAELGAAAEGCKILEGRHWIAELLEADPRSTVVFPVLHGPHGEDGSVQGLLELLGLAYVGAGVGGSAAAMNKIHSKQILAAGGLPVILCQFGSLADWESDPDGFLDSIESSLDYPVFVKPANLGSSIGIHRSRNRDELDDHVEEAFQYDDYVLVERALEVREIEVSVLGNLEPRVSVPGEIIPSRDFYSYEAKYLDDSSKLLIPASLEPDQAEEIQTLALEAFQALHLEGMARVDFLVEKKDGTIWLNEANTIPGFTAISMYPKLWEASGLAYPDLLATLIELAKERWTRRSRLSVEWRR